MGLGHTINMLQIDLGICDEKEPISGPYRYHVKAAVESISRSCISLHPSSQIPPLYHLNKANPPAGKVI